MSSTSVGASPLKAKLFRCGTCSEDFPTLATCVAHMKTHSAASVVQPESSPNIPGAGDSPTKIATTGSTLLSKALLAANIPTASQPTGVLSAATGTVPVGSGLNPVAVQQVASVAGVVSGGQTSGMSAGLQTSEGPSAGLLVRNVAEPSVAENTGSAPPGGSGVLQEAHSGSAGEKVMLGNVAMKVLGQHGVKGVQTAQAAHETTPLLAAQSEKAVSVINSSSIQTSNNEGLQHGSESKTSVDAASSPGVATDESQKSADSSANSVLTAAGAQTEEAVNTAHVAGKPGVSVSTNTSNSSSQGTPGKDNQRPYECTVCKARFSHMSSLSTHKRRHLGIAPYSCKDCNKQFWDPSNLRVHLRIHSNKRPYVCDICGHRANQANDIKTHRRVHTGEMPFSCTVADCGKTFRDASHFRRHMKKHAGVKPHIPCDRCDAMFYNLSTLARHRRKHTGEKDYQCQLCMAKFARLDTLRLHQRTHTGEKPYQCGECGIRFADRSQCRRHIKKANHRSSTIIYNQPAAQQNPQVKQEPMDVSADTDTSNAVAVPKKTTVLQVPLPVTNGDGSTEGDTTYETIEIELPDTTFSDDTDAEEVTYQYGEMLITISRSAVSQLQEAKTENAPNAIENGANAVENVQNAVENVQNAVENVQNAVGNVENAVENVGNSMQNVSKTAKVVPGKGDPSESVANVTHTGENEQQSTLEENIDASMLPCTHCGATFAKLSELQEHYKKHYTKRGRRTYVTSNVARANASGSVLPGNLTKQNDNTQVNNSSVAISNSPQDRPVGTHPLSEQNNLISDLTDHEYPLSPESTAVEMKRQRTPRTGERRFVCPQCGAAFIYMAELRRHGLKHTGEKPYVCRICGKRVRDPSNLKRHIRTHTGERPYKCRHCDKRFAQAGHLSAHLRIHTGERPFACDQCDARFVESNHLRHHLKVHAGVKPFKCDQCDYSFIRSAELRRHKLIHSGTKNWKCKECPATFFRSDALKQHMAKHLKVVESSRHRCTLCPQSFASAGFLHRHMVRVHLKREARQQTGKSDAENSVAADALCELATGRRASAAVEKDAQTTPVSSSDGKVQLVVPVGAEGAQVQATESAQATEIDSLVKEETEQSNMEGTDAIESVTVDLDQIPEGSIILADGLGDGASYMVISGTDGATAQLASILTTPSSAESTPALSSSNMSVAAMEVCTTTDTPITALPISSSIDHQYFSQPVAEQVNSQTAQFIVSNETLELTMQSLLTGQAHLESLSAVEVGGEDVAAKVAQGREVMIKQEPPEETEQNTPVAGPLRTRSGRERKIKVKFSM